MSSKICLRTFQPFNRRTLRFLEVWGPSYPLAQCKIPEEINPQPSMLLPDLSKILNTHYVTILFHTIKLH